MKFIATQKNTILLLIAIFFNMTGHASDSYVFAHAPLIFQGSVPSPIQRSQTLSPNPSLQSFESESPQKGIPLEQVSISVGYNTFTGYRPFTESPTGMPIHNPSNSLNSPRDTTTEQERAALIEQIYERQKWHKRCTYACAWCVPLLVAGCIIYATMS